jgi:hypothetical protein
MKMHLNLVAVLATLSLPTLLNAECITGNCFDGRGAYIYPSGAKYVGEFKNGFIDGMGTLYFSTGDVYVGEWTKQYREGKGKYTYKNGDVYRGTFKNNKFHGNGTMDYNNGDQYSGAWSESQPNGQGTYLFKSGEKYIGSFVQGKFDGNGTMYYKDGSKYIGEWKRNEKNGTGVFIKSNGSKISGDWANGNYIKEEPSFDERVSENNRSNNTNQTTSSTNTSEREVETSVDLSRDCNSMYCRDGVGTYIYADGSKFIGEMKYGFPEGKGKVYYANGDIYEGQWTNHAPNGPGVIYFANGKAYGGIWRNGKTVGEIKPARQPVKDEPVIVDYSDEVKIWAVVVGVGGYKHMPALKYTDDDAYHMYAFLKSVEGGSLKEEQVKVLVDEEATRMNVLNTVHDVLLRADDNDVIVFYFSGHGLQGSFLPVDYDGYNNRILHEEIRDLMMKSKAKQKVVFADACYSGSILAMKAPVEQTLDRYYDAFKGTNGGIALMMSSKGEEFSLEDGGLRSGIFSYYLIKGLKGAADADFNKIVTISELFAYVKRQVVNYTAGAQTPTLSGNFDDGMPVAVRR